MPAGIVEHQHDPSLRPGARLAREGGEQTLEEGLGDAVGQVPDDLAGGRLHEGRDVEPFEAVMAEGDRSLAPRCPDSARDRFQTDPVLVRGEDLDGLVRMSRGLLGHGFAELFLNASRASGVAEAGFLGRGR